MADSPTQRTMRYLREQGAVCAVVEKWNQHAGPFGIRQDLFGIVDILVLDPGRGFLGIQACGQAFSAHKKKLLEDKAQECIDWLSTPSGFLEIWSWRKVVVKRGGKAKRWQPRIYEITMADFEEAR